VSALRDIYLTSIRVSWLSQLQYRVGLAIWIVGLAIEPVVYLVVWTTVADAQGGSVGGFTRGAFAAYYIVWIVVRVMNIALTPWAFEERVQRGALSPMLLRPIHPFHVDLADFIAMKLVSLLILVPVIGVLVVLFDPSFQGGALDVALFAVATWTGFLMRFILVWALGLVTFWIVRIGAIFDLYFAVELLLSGRIVPIDLLPPWARTAAALLPFRWSFGFPIELALGRLDGVDAAIGFGMQAFWAAVGTGALVLLWRRGVRRYSAVGA